MIYVVNELKLFSREQLAHCLVRYSLGKCEMLFWLHKRTWVARRRRSRVFAALLICVLVFKCFHLRVDVLGVLRTLLILMDVHRPIGSGIGANALEFKWPRSKIRHINKYNCGGFFRSLIWLLLIELSNWLLQSWFAINVSSLTNLQRNEAN